MNKKDFNNISLRGRAAYGISCLTTYLKSKYPDKDFSLVLDIACKITEDSNYIDESVMAYTEIIPEYLYEFDNYADAEFEYLSENQYNELINVLPNDDKDLNTIMLAIRNIIWEYCYVDIEKNAPAASKHLMNILEIFKRISLTLPKLDNFNQYSFDYNNGWGKYIMREEYL